MNTSDILTLYEYNYWANQRIMAASARVSLEQFVAPTGHNYGSLRGTLVHTLEGECAWRMLYQRQTLEHFGAMKEEDFPTLDVLARRWSEDERAMRDYLAGLTDGDLAGHLRYTTDEGDQRDRPLWHCLFHVVNHGTQHRSEAAAILTGYDCSPGDMDFTAYLNEQH